MRLLINNHIANAIESLRSNRLRTGLTVLGITVGIASITVILSLSAGATKIIGEQINELGDSIIVVRPKSPNVTQITSLTAALSRTSITSSLTERDTNMIGAIKGVQSVAPLMFIGGSVSNGENTPSNASIVATTSSIKDTVSLPIDSGQFFDDTTLDNTAVVGSQLSVDLFGTEQSLGKTFTTHGKTFRVIGVLLPLNRPVNYNNVDFDRSAIINLTSGKLFNQGVASIQQIDIRTVSRHDLSSVLPQIDSLLSRNHAGEQDYEILSGTKLAKPTNDLFNTIAATLSTVAAISLIVGGIGIMNIMLVSVTERTREIGIRKAIGASRSHIIWQFLIEALAMSLAGGIFGYIFGYIVAFTLSRTFLTFDPAFTWFVAASSVGISVAVGLIFGLYPAISAARKNPIEALRNYN